MPGNPPLFRHAFSHTCWPAVPRTALLAAVSMLYLLGTCSGCSPPRAIFDRSTPARDLAAGLTKLARLVWTTAILPAVLHHLPRMASEGAEGSLGTAPRHCSRLRPAAPHRGARRGTRRAHRHHLGWRLKLLQLFLCRLRFRDRPLLDQVRLQAPPVCHGEVPRLDPSGQPTGCCRHAGPSGAATSSAVRREGSPAARNSRRVPGCSQPGCRSPSHA